MISAISSVEKGSGLYSFDEVAGYLRHLELPKSTLRSWFRSRSKSGPIIQGDIDPDENWLSFRDFTDVYVAAYLRSKGVKPNALREALIRCKEDWKVAHPLSKRGTEFSVDRTTGHVLVLPEGHSHHHFMTGPSRNQLVFKPVLDKYLSKLEFDEVEFASRYVVWSQHIGGKEKRVVMEPALNFGEPTVEGTPYRAITLRDASEAEGSSKEAAELYEVDESDVIIAIEAFKQAPELRKVA